MARSENQTPPQDYRRGDFDPERMILNDPLLREQGGGAPRVDVCDQFDGPVDAVVDYSFGNFKLLVTGLPPVQDGGLTPEVASKAPTSRLRVATFNVENLDPRNDAARFPPLARRVVENLRSPDIVMLEEMQDNDGETSEGDSNADVTFRTLTAAIAAAGGPRYEYRQIDPVRDQDGGVPGGNIVVGNHLNSKGGDEALFGRFQEPRRPSEIQRRGRDGHSGQAGTVNAWVRRLLDVDPQANVVVLGDFDDFDFSETARVVERGAPGDEQRELLDLWRLLAPLERYSYVFEGNAQALDHVFVSPDVALRGKPELDPVHINAEFADQLSDHDPLVAQLRVGHDNGRGND